MKFKSLRCFFLCCCRNHLKENEFKLSQFKFKFKYELVNVLKFVNLNTTVINQLTNLSLILSLHIGISEGDIPGIKSLILIITFFEADVIHTFLHFVNVTYLKSNGFNASNLSLELHHTPKKTVQWSIYRNSSDISLHLWPIWPIWPSISHSMR